MPKLTDMRVRKTAEAGMHGDGGGLYLRVTANGAKSWIFRFRLWGRSREAGLGSYPSVTLAEAREKAAEARKLTRQGIDPIEARRAAEAPLRVTTFADVAAQYIDAHRSSWKSVKTLERARRLERYACNAFGPKAVAEVETADVLKLLKPLWIEKAETATALREWVEGVLNFAKAKGKRQGENPAAWRGHLAHLLPARNKAATVKHYPALPWQELPAFVADLRTRDALAARALEVTILTACRTSEVLQADRSEIDDDLWIIPAVRMKMAREHRVPLSRQATTIFAALPVLADNPYVFPGHRKERPLSGMAMEMLLRRMERDDITVHGFRSTFRDWAAENTSFPREVVELCLAHDVGTAVERAYRRSDLLEKRRELMQIWANYASPDEKSLPCRR